MYPSFAMGGQLDADTLMAREHAYRPIPTVDAAVETAILALAGKPANWVPWVKVASKYHEMTGKRVNDAIAEALGLPSMMGLAAAYLRRATHKFATKMVGTEFCVCVCQTKMSVPPTIIPAPSTATFRVEVGIPAQTNMEAAFPKSERIEDFAYIAWFKILPCLKEYAFDENWGPNQWVLRNKIMFTFQWLYRRWCEAKTQEEKNQYIYISSDRTLAAINLGLVDKMFSEMYLTFGRNPRTVPYWYADETSIITKMAVAPRNPATERLTESLRPRWPYFIRTAEEIAFVPGANICPPAAKHLFERLERFPNAVLERFCQDDPAVLQQCRIATALRKQDTAFSAEQIPQLQACFASLSRAFAGSISCQRNLDLGFTSAITDLKHRIKWNYRTLIPAYYPKNDRPNASGSCISLLAPLNFSLGNPNNIDVVMVLSYDKATNAYHGSTILTPAMAYSNARLLCRLNDNWLDAAFV